MQAILLEFHDFFKLHPSNPIASRLYLNLLMWEHFPCLSMLYSKCGEFWEQGAALGTEPVKMEFASLFYCMAINLDLGEAVHSWPHRDKMNLSVGLCVIFVFGSIHFTLCQQAINLHHVGFFDDGELAWLVILESGVFVQLPPGVFFAFPSALLTHWSGDKKGERLIVIQKPAPKRPKQSPVPSQMYLKRFKSGLQSAGRPPMNIIQHHCLFPRAGAAWFFLILRHFSDFP
jgi:hypothetical protein